MPEAIWTKLISCHHNNFFASHFGFKKTCELLVQKYFWPSQRHDIKAYIKSCDVYLASKMVRYKPYGNLQSLPVPTLCWKNLSMDFVTSLPILTNWKRDSYDSILVIVDPLTNMVHHEQIKITINTLSLAELIIDVIILYHSFLNSIVMDRGFLLILKFWLSLWYFLSIKRQFFPIFHPQNDGQTKRQNSTIEAYLRAFVNFKQNY